MQPSANWKTLPLFLLACLLTLSFGGLFSPGPWYEGLQRAPWNPPAIAFPIVWSILYLLIAVAGWKIFASKAAGLKRLWIVQLVLNGAWSWLFFGQHWVAAALLDILLLDAVVAMLILGCFKARHPTAAWLLLPYLLWIVLATTLNGYIFIMN